MMSLITIVAGSLVEHEPLVVLIYRIYDPSSNRALAEPPVHSHLKHTAHIDAYLSLLEKQTARHTHNLKKKGSQEDCQHVLRRWNPLKNRAKRQRNVPVESVLIYLHVTDQ